MPEVPERKLSYGELLNKNRPPRPDIMTPGTRNTPTSEEPKKQDNRNGIVRVSRLMRTPRDYPGKRDFGYGRVAEHLRSITHEED